MANINVYKRRHEQFGASSNRFKDINVSNLLLSKLSKGRWSFSEWYNSMKNIKIYKRFFKFSIFGVCSRKKQTDRHTDIQTDRETEKRTRPWWDEIADLPPKPVQKLFKNVDETITLDRVPGWANAEVSNEPGSPTYKYVKVLLNSLVSTTRRLRFNAIVYGMGLRGGERHGMAGYSSVRYNTVQCGTVQYLTVSVWYGTTRYRTERCDELRRGTVW